MSELKPWDEGYVAPTADPDIMSKVMAVAREANAVRVKEKKAKDPNFKQHVRDPESKNSKRLAKMDDKLSTKKKRFLDMFVTEYLYDFSAPKAFVRAGGPQQSAHTQSYKDLRTGYVQRKLRDLIEAMEEENLVTDKQIVIGLVTEANTFGEGSSQTGRVAAWKLLAQLKGKLIKKTENTNHTTGGVMLIPVHASTEEWEKVAQSSQEQLKNDVRT